jgi:hypothetical protein
MPHAPGLPRPTLWTLPNAVSLSRVVLAAGFVVSSGGAERLALVGVASLTDMLDGWLARRLGVASRWGRADRTGRADRDLRDRARSGTRSCANVGAVAGAGRGARSLRGS